ncbi:DUF262 domain-containing protein [Cellulomonas sp. DKR-3]|uniref:DUF262 domain-containing protein n=1 Tax=Cellulomonas fulva TaxID=2835530 RepID=A0ABS5U2A7_9CELL|nr:DUF262 domain-containing protein [Cellulomonas fulva]MBT0995529.1 DUF262 domain-containing protein [Cellulomonas fulva]
MEAHPRRLRAVFSRDVRLVVPLFQRAYVWEAETQWSPLWDDVLATYERSRHNDDTAHFLGAVVLQLRPGALGAIEQREVIDGQQRMTTLQLLIAAVADAFTRRGIESRTSRRLRRLLENDKDAVEDDVELYKLWPTNRDRAEYRAVLDGRLLEAEPADVSGQIGRAYLWFRDAIDAWLNGLGDDDSDERLTRLADVLGDLLEVVVIDLSEDDDSQVIFETLNARGTPLRASDLIKNLLFRTLQDAGRPVEKLYAEHWRELEDPYWEQSVRIGRLVRERLDVFMGHFLVLLLNAEVQSHSLFDTSRRYVRGDAARADRLLGEIARYARIYRALDERTALPEREQAVLARIALADTQTVVPLQLWLYAHTADAERLRALKLLESYLVRRTVCRMTAKNLNRTFLELLRSLGQEETTAAETIETYLTSLRGDSGVWPTDADLSKAFTTFPLYRMMRRAQLQQVLLALDAAATGPRAELVEHKHKLSIEHLLPQSWRDNWPLPDEERAAEREAEAREALLHTIGNLALVTGPLNSALSNGSWPTKRAAILEHSAFTLNRTLPTDWGTWRIEERSKRLTEIAVELWPRPASGLVETTWSPEVEAPAEVATPGPGTGGRGDIAAHIAEAFAGLEAGAFLTISQIRRHRSRAYPDGPPSAGAISARLFPRDGRPTTIEGVVPDFDNGVRGARKE